MCVYTYIYIYTHIHTHTCRHVYPTIPGSGPVPYPRPGLGPRLGATQVGAFDDRSHGLFYVNNNDLRVQQHQCNNRPVVQCPYLRTSERPDPTWLCVWRACCDIWCAMQDAMQRDVRWREAHGTVRQTRCAWLSWPDARKSANAPRRNSTRMKREEISITTFYIVFCPFENHGIEIPGDKNYNRMSWFNKSSNTLDIW